MLVISMKKHNSACLFMYYEKALDEILTNLNKNSYAGYKHIVAETKGRPFEDMLKYISVNEDRFFCVMTA